MLAWLHSVHSLRSRSKVTSSVHTRDTFLGLGLVSWGRLADFLDALTLAAIELTFDYLDKDMEEEERICQGSARLLYDKKPCNCGARKCRGYLWV